MRRRSASTRTSVDVELHRAAVRGTGTDRQHVEDAAEQALRKSIGLAQERAEGYVSLAALFLVSNQSLPEARALAQKGGDLAPTAGHYVLLSRACYRNQEPVVALAAIKRAAELDPDNVQIRKAYERLQQEQ